MAYYSYNNHSIDNQDPKYIHYDPTQFIISYSVAVSEFNETENFEEYDTTPYGGGYNLNLTYGNPLPPSDDICYPRPSSAAVAPPAALPPIAVPPAKPEAESKGAKNDVVEEESNFTSPGRGNDVMEEESNLNASGGQNGNFGSGGREVGYEVNNEMPYGYGLEAMDICEGLFGYWPCVTKCRRRLDDYQRDLDSGNCRNPWDGTADYLFGSPNPYVQSRDVDHYNTSYGQNFWGS
ncbi:hypothetical protein M5689_023710 [Euphorbia peplus]|nr:hypothetical protein M5689_023710 [Euphorbia peplus]